MQFPHLNAGVSLALPPTLCGNCRTGLQQSGTSSLNNHRMAGMAEVERQLVVDENV